MDKREIVAEASQKLLMNCELPLIIRTKPTAFKTCIHSRGMADWRGILPLVEANFRRNTGCISRKLNEEQRQKIRQDAAQRL